MTQEDVCYAGADWITASLSILNGRTLSPLGEAAANLLGDVFLGIYHLDYGALKKVRWDDTFYVEVVVYGSFSSVDDNNLTRLLVLAHDRMLRVELKGCAPGYLKIGISQRSARDGRLWERCPTWEDAVSIIRSHYQRGQS